jgi:hypothetical protein
VSAFLGCDFSATLNWHAEANFHVLDRFLDRSNPSLCSSPAS